MNPVLNAKTMTRVTGAEPMTLSGTVTQSIFLLLLLIGTAIVSGLFLPGAGMGVAAIAALVAFVVVMVAMFKPDMSPMLAPVYAITEGVVVGIVSVMYNAASHGIVIQAAMFTFGTLFGMLALYQTRIITVNAKFRSIIFAATVGIAITYLATFVASLLGFHTSFLYSSSPVSIGISVVICIVAALNFLLDFDNIERGIANGVPKAYESVSALGLLVTTVWLYLEFLRLLSKLRDR